MAGYDVRVGWESERVGWGRALARIVPVRAGHVGRPVESLQEQQYLGCEVADFCYGKGVEHWDAERLELLLWYFG